VTSTSVGIEIETKSYRKSYAVYTHRKLEPDKHVHMAEKFQNENLSAAINLAYQGANNTDAEKATTKFETSAIKRFLSKHLSLEISAK